MSLKKNVCLDATLYVKRLIDCIFALIEYLLILLQYFIRSFTSRFLSSFVNLDNCRGYLSAHTLTSFMTWGKGKCSWVHPCQILWSNFWYVNIPIIMPLEIIISNAAVHESVANIYFPGEYLPSAKEVHRAWGVVRI